MTQERRHAAIMFTDIVGYTSLMGSDEDRAIEILNKNKEIHTRLIEQFNGTLIKEMGDGMMVCFDLSSDAVRCAIELQNAATTESIPLKIGIDQGEMVFGSGDVHGDGVNIAFRLQEGASKGDIHISAAVYQNIKNKADIHTRFISEKTFKNVDEPVKVYEVHDGSVTLPYQALDSAGKTKKKGNKVLVYTVVILVSIIGAFVLWKNTLNKDSSVSVNEELTKSIAVLPFKNLSGDPEQEYLCDGLTDEIINNLFKIESFEKVSSLSSILTYKNSEKRVPEIARDLGVNFILEGTFSKSGDDIRINAQLIEAETDKHIWSNQYKGSFSEIFKVQSDIALRIGENIKTFISESESDLIKNVPTDNQEAYEKYQKAFYIYYSGLSSNSDEPFVDQSLAYLREVIALDPNFADAYSFMALITLTRGSYAGSKQIREAVSEAEPLYNKALELDPNNPGAHSGLAIINEWANWDYIEAEKYYQRSLDLEPNNSEFWDVYIEFLLKRSQFELVLEYIDILYKKDIAGPSYLKWSKALSRLGKPVEAEQKIQEGLELFGKDFLVWAGESYIWLEDYSSALKYVDSAKTQIHLPRFSAYKALALNKLGRKNEADTIVKRLIEESYSTAIGSPSYFTGWYYSGIGEVDSAFHYLYKAYENGSPEMPWLKVYPVFESLKADDRYWDLYEKTGHQAYDDNIANQ